MLSEQEVLSQLMQQSERGLETLMRQYTGLVYTIVHGKLATICTQQDIEECVSDIFCELYENRRALDLEKGSLKAYLAVLAKRRAVDVYRRHKRQTETLSIDEGEQDILPAPLTVEDCAAVREQNALLLQTIKALGEPDSEIIIRKYYFGQPSKAIARALGLKANTVDKRVSRALIKLRQAMEVWFDGT